MVGRSEEGGKLGVLEIGCHFIKWAKRGMITV